MEALKMMLCLGLGLTIIGGCMIWLAGGFGAEIQSGAGGIVLMFVAGLFLLAFCALIGIVYLFFAVIPKAVVSFWRKKVSRSA